MAEPVPVSICTAIDHQRVSEIDHVLLNSKNSATGALMEFTRIRLLKIHAFLFFFILDFLFNVD